jgi:ATP-dependent exoDNAse (exonuclease V) beta subunit
MENESKSLIVLNASAGSGKTYSLVLKYLSLLLDETKNSTFANILAMTFTNKAANEMKVRIIGALDLLSGIFTDEDKVRKRKDLIASLEKETGLTEQIIRFKSKQVLKDILHHFEDFQILTIDKFNLRLIRSFSKELNLSNDFTIVLDETEVLSQAVDQLIDQLDADEAPELTKLMLNYAKEKLQEEESWNFQTELKKFAQLLTDEKYFSDIDTLIKSDYSKERLKEIKHEFEIQKDKIQEQANRLYALFEGVAIDRLPGKSRNADAYKKLVSDKLLIQNGFEGGFFTEAHLALIDKPVGKGQEMPDNLRLETHNFHQYYQREIQRYHLLREISKDFFNLSLLQHIARDIDTIRDKENIIRISEFNKLISELIQQEKAPFIYERLGNRYKHYMLDEFQDTSRLQWMNIIPLIEESLSYQYANLIVGDPKQSIYRFKNGLAEQFIELPRIYNPEGNPEIALKSELFNYHGDLQNLASNYRSQKEIVEFNNSFFSVIKKELDEEKSKFYASEVQIPAGKNGGYVEVVSVELEEEQLNSQLQYLFKWIESCLSDNFNPGDICILGNTKKECNQWAIELSKKKYKVVSADSLLVDSDYYVKLVMAYLRLRIHPKGRLETKRFLDFYNELIQPIEYNGNLDNFVVEYFENEQFFFFKYESIYALIQKTLVLFGLNEIENPYLHHLLDLAFNFDNQFGPDLTFFVEEYDKKGKSTSIQVPENKDAIIIMTGHKSKGLEFPVVILPNMDFNLESKSSKLLIKCEEGYIYSRLSKNSAIQVVKEQTEAELANIFLDKLNLAYVMMTRPVNRLYVLNGYADKNPKNFGTYFQEVVQELAQKKILDLDKDLQGFPRYFRGITAKKKLDERTAITTSNFTPQPLNETLWYPDIVLDVQKSMKENGVSEQIRFGNQLHELLASVNTIEEVDDKVNSLVAEGKIEVQFKERLISQSKKILTFPDYVEIVSNATQVYNEQSILSEDRILKRPDKIIIHKDKTFVVDYKSGMASEKHIKQMGKYIELLELMEFPEVKGVLFYTNQMRMQFV